mmetsp:Transcript_45529/g.90208  ORF Transcript_45529/g.90208 Transcript_45529/m.90208 type:complete len:240 (+) Transcript_45529:326-1045(+)
MQMLLKGSELSDDMLAKMAELILMVNLRHCLVSLQPSQLSAMPIPHLTNCVLPLLVLTFALLDQAAVLFPNCTRLVKCEGETIPHFSFLLTLSFQSTLACSQFLIKGLAAGIRKPLNVLARLLSLLKKCLDLPHLFHLLRCHAFADCPFLGSLHYRERLLKVRDTLSQAPVLLFYFLELCPYEIQWPRLVPAVILRRRNEEVNRVRWVQIHVFPNVGVVVHAQCSFGLGICDMYGRKEP